MKNRFLTHPLTHASIDFPLTPLHTCTAYHCTDSLYILNAEEDLKCPSTRHSRTDVLCINATFYAVFDAKQSVNFEPVVLPPPVLCRR